MVLALLAAALCAATAWGFGFPPIGHMPVHPMKMKGGFFPGPMYGGGFGGGYTQVGGGGGYGQQQQVQEVMTCIAKDYQDLNSQVRLTLTPSRRSGGMGSFQGGYFGVPMGMDSDFDNFDDDEEGMYMMGPGGFVGGGGGGSGFGGEYRIDGTFVPSIALNKAGTYYVVITRYGRTADGCSADALGPIYNKNTFSGGVGGGPAGYPVGGFGMAGFGMGGYPGPYNSYGQAFYGGGGNQGSSAPIGQLQNPAIVGASATIYSTHINGVSKRDLLGRGLALCRSVSNGRCQGQIPYCCTIQRDSLSAMEVFVGGEEDNNFDFPLAGGGNLVGVGPALGGAALGGGIAASTGGINAAASTGGLF